MSKYHWAMAHGFHVWCYDQIWHHSGELLFSHCRNSPNIWQHSNGIIFIETYFQKQYIILSNYPTHTDLIKAVGGALNPKCFEAPTVSNLSVRLCRHNKHVGKRESINTLVRTKGSNVCYHHTDVSSDKFGFKCIFDAVKRGKWCHDWQLLWVQLRGDVTPAFHDWFQIESPARWGSTRMWLQLEEVGHAIRDIQSLVVYYSDFRVTNTHHCLSVCKLSPSMILASK